MPASTPRTDRLSRYETRTDRPLLVLAASFVVVYAVLVIAADLPETVRRVFDAASWLVWAAFATDLVIRSWLSGRPGRYLFTHPVDVLIVLLPALRPLRVLRVFAAGQALVSRGGRLSPLRSTQAIVTAAAVLVVIAALAALDAERDAPDAHITTFGDALWWAATTVTTVGYGDTFPVTGTGRLVAVALMLVGISLVGLVTATVAAWFVAQTAGATKAEEADLAARLAGIEATLEDIRIRLAGAGDRAAAGGGSVGRGRAGGAEFGLGVEVPGRLDP